MVMEVISSASLVLDAEGWRYLLGSLLSHNIMDKVNVILLTPSLDLKDFAEIPVQ